MPFALCLCPITAFRQLRYKYGISLRIFLVSAGETVVVCRSLLLRFLPFPESRWLLKPLLLLILPLAVTLNRLTAPLLLLILGTSTSFQIGNSQKAIGITVYRLAIALCLLPTAFYLFYFGVRSIAMLLPSSRG